MKGYLFVALFIIVNLYFILKYGEEYRKKIFAIPKLEGSHEKICTVLYALLFNGTIVYICFQDVEVASIYFIVGMGAFVATLVLFVMTLSTYATTSFNDVVKNGVYKITRNPQQLFAELLWMAVGIAIQNQFVIILGILKLVILYPSMLAQERFCIEKYGQEYIDYMKKTPRYLFFLPWK